VDTDEPGQDDERRPTHAAAPGARALHSVKRLVASIPALWLMPVLGTWASGLQGVGLALASSPQLGVSGSLGGNNYYRCLVGAVLLSSWPARVHAAEEPEAGGKRPDRARQPDGRTDGRTEMGEGHGPWATYVCASQTDFTIKR
jgi:hypothetical protein